MSNKRAAASDLNHDNWNLEEEPEEMGTYKRASPNALKMRPMKKAKRRGITGDNEGGPSVFKNFKGFGTADSSTAPTFNFLNNDGEKPKLSIGGTFPSFSFGNIPVSNKVGETKAIDTQSSENSTSIFGSTPSSTTFKNNIDKGGNKSSAKPVFEFTVTDTNKNTIESSSKPTFSFGVPAADKNIDKPVSSGFSFNSSKKESADKSVIESSSKPVTFGVTDTTKNSNSAESSPKPTFSFGVTSSNKNGDKTLLSNFNFNPSKPGGDISSTFKFGINDNTSISSVTSQQNKQSSDNTSGENSSYSNDNKSTEPQSSKVNGITETPKTEKKKSKLFLANLKALNLGVVKWVQQHLDKNQYINLIPIFEDYKAHFEDIKKRFDNDDTQQIKSNKNVSSNQVKESSSVSKNNSSSDRLKFGSSSTTGSKADPFPSVSSSSDEQQQNEVQNEKTISNQKPFTFGVIKSSEKSETNSESTTKPSGLVFNFGKSNSNPAFSFSSEKSKPSFNFGSVDNSSSSTTSGFSFGTSKDDKTGGFSFATATESKPSQESKDDENEVEEKVEDEQMPEIKEEDAVYDKKVKLFLKKEGKFDTIGVGTLYIKPVKDKEKSQLIVRADNSLGTVLLNIVLNDSIPTQRVGKNNVLIACVPNPPLACKDPNAPASILIRVKEEEDADELLEKLNHYKTGKESN